MVQILIGSTKVGALFELINVFEEAGIQVMWAGSCEAVIEKVETETVDLIIIDEYLSGLKGITCIRKIVSLNPILNCAAVSSLSHKEFHESSEGLGILMQIPVNPKREDAEKMLEHLNSVLNLTKRTTK
jgi:two-component SAPR family response regulator